ncbi:MAG: FAD:protein FMN transferase [Verrucomicrobiae bacterium]|nr:FAD:protein FMN transferase [Verrucomicrobiae bacterium]
MTISLPGPLSASEWHLLTFKEPHMGTEFTIRAWTEEGRESDLTRLVERAFARVKELDAALSDYLPESEINRLAKAPKGKAVIVSEDLFLVFEKAGKVTEASGGVFDITAGPLIRLWRMSRKNNALPTPEQIASAKARTGFHHLVLDAEKRTITKTMEGMLFDAGGIAKGYAADAALAILKDGGFPRSLVAASGDIVVGSPPPGEQGWRIGIETLEIGHDLKDLQTVTLSDSAISTSGDTRRYFEHGGVRYSHIVSPATGLGLTERTGASVIAPDATTSDSFATAVTLLGPKEGLQFIRNQRGIECQIVVLRDGHEAFLRSDGFPSPQGPQVQQESPVPAP